MSENTDSPNIYWLIPADERDFLIHWDKAHNDYKQLACGHDHQRFHFCVMKVVVMLCHALSWDYRALWSSGLTWCHVFLELNIYCSLSNSKSFVKKNTNKSESLRADRYLRKNSYFGYDSHTFDGQHMDWDSQHWWWSPWLASPDEFQLLKFCWSLQSPKRHYYSNAVKCSSASACLFCYSTSSSSFLSLLGFKTNYWNCFKYKYSNLSRGYIITQKEKSPALGLHLIFFLFFFQSSISAHEGRVIKQRN